MALALCVAASLGVLACSDAEREEPAEEVSWPEVEALYQEAVYDTIWFGTLDEQAQKEADLWSRMPFETISLESLGCYGSCPIYKVTFLRGGTAHFSGDSFVGELEGEFEGTIDIHKFARLCLFVDRFRFRDLDAYYDANWTDDNTITIRVTPTGATEPLEVSDYGEQAPPEFMALQMAIELLVRSIEWE